MKTRRMIASALAFIMATTVMSGSVFAAGEKVTISAQKVEVPSGTAEISIDISLEGVPAGGINACEFAIEYDQNLLSVTGVKAGAITNTGADAAETDISGELPAFYCDYSTKGSVQVTWCTGLDSKDYWISKDGVFMTITGVVAPGTTSGSCDIKIVPISRDNSGDAIVVGLMDASGSVSSYEAAVSNGSVTIAAAGTTTTTGTDPIVTTTTTTTTEPGPGPVASLLGDVNLDGVISLTDVLVLNKGIATGSLNAQQKANAQCFADELNVIDGKDATALLRRIANLEKTLPVLPV